MHGSPGFKTHGTYAGEPSPTPALAPPGLGQVPSVTALAAPSPRLPGSPSITSLAICLEGLKASRAENGCAWLLHLSPALGTVLGLQGLSSRLETEQLHTPEKGRHGARSQRCSQDTQSRSVHPPSTPKANAF